ncbi:MAG: hypothetical protein E7384_05105 [Ruminococcaceae bacterium]|nr:hypothetical protein [Oscillospiraceae bacterium]
MRKSVRFLSVALVLCILTAFFAPYVQTVQTVQGASLKITLDPGHGGSDPGTAAAFDNGGSHYESWYNLEISKAAKERLEKYGVTVYMTRTADTAVSLSDRVDIAVNNGSDALISIHNNSAGSSAYGSVACVPTNNYRPEMGKKSSSMAEDILSKLENSPGTRNRGLLKESYSGLYYPDGSTADYYAINRYAKQRGLSAAMIIECVFCTNSGDVALLEKESSRTQMGYSIADGIAKYYGLKLAEEKPVVPKYKAEIKASNAGGKVGFNDSYTVSSLSGLADGSVVAFNVKSDSGYKCSSVSVNGKNITISGNGTGFASYQTPVSGGDVKISVSFEKILYKLGVYRVTTDFLNVREAPNANDGTKILGAFNTGDRFTVTEITNTHWGKVVYNGQIGYISIHLNYAEHVSDLIIESNDIVFDNADTVKWVKDYVPGSTAVSLYTDQTTEDVLMKVENSSDNKPCVDFRFDKLGSMYADKYKYIMITAKTSDSGNAKFYIYTDSASETVVKNVKWTSDGLWHTYLIDLSDVGNRKGSFKNIKVEYFDSNGAGNALFIRNIRFFTDKPTIPAVSLGNTVMDLAGSVKISYSGMDSYFGANDNISPYIAVYSATSDHLGEPLFKKYLTNGSGTIDFSANSTDGKIDEGSFKVRLGYDAKGSANKSFNLHTVLFLNESAVKSLTVEKPVRHINGLYRVYIPRNPDGVVLLRANPSDYSVATAAVPNGANVFVTNVSDDWGLVSYNGIDGWLNIVKNMNFISETDSSSEVKDYPAGDVNRDFTVNVNDIVETVKIKMGTSDFDERRLAESGLCLSGETVSRVTLSKLYRLICGS